MELEIEARIQDTTQVVEETQDECPLPCECIACSKIFKESDPGVSFILKRCDECYTNLKRDLANQIDGTIVNQETAEVFPDNAVGDVPFFAPEADGSAFPSYALTQEIIDGAVGFALNSKGKVRKFSLPLNGDEETFTLELDPINAGARKLFKRASWTIPQLYWYHIYGAMTLPRCSPIITPCIVELTDPSDATLIQIKVLVAICRTMCFNPRYDALLVDLETKQAGFFQFVSKYTKKMRYDVMFNRGEVDR